MGIDLVPKTKIIGAIFSIWMLFIVVVSLVTMYSNKKSSLTFYLFMKDLWEGGITDLAQLSFTFD